MKKFVRKEFGMNQKNALVAAIIFGGTVALAGNYAWSQEAPGETRQPFPEQTRPGENEGIPGMHGGGTQELSTRDMQAVQQVLKDKGYKVTVDGTANDVTRAAIRKFQQDEGLTVTGMIDEPTANRLGFQMRSQNPSGAPAGSRQPGSTYQPGTGRPGSNNPDITEPKRGSTGGRQESTDGNPK
jgi:peptidoglycan hydrolase-like protein with peptidoglycan-binding domain